MEAGASIRLTGHSVHAGATLYGLKPPMVRAMHPLQQAKL